MGGNAAPTMPHNYDFDLCSDYKLRKLRAHFELSILGTCCGNFDSARKLYDVPGYSMAIRSFDATIDGSSSGRFSPDARKALSTEHPCAHQ